MGDAMRFLDRLIKGEEIFDLLFADPPYAGDLAQRIVARIEEGGRAICRLLVIEHDRPLFHRENGPLEPERTRKFGQTLVTYFRFAGGGDGG